MKSVFFIRHAKSSWEDPSLSDIERPLNKRGFRDAPFMAKLLKGKSITPDKIITSPANRAYTTATYFAQELNIHESSMVIRKEIYHAYPEDVLGIIRSLDKNDDVILVFGHNPCFTSIANRFSEDYIPNVPTCGIVQIEADVSKWSDFQEHGKFKSFYFPKQYFK